MCLVCKHVTNEMGRLAVSQMSLVPHAGSSPIFKQPNAVMVANVAFTSHLVCSNLLYRTKKISGSHKPRQTDLLAYQLGAQFRILRGAVPLLAASIQPQSPDGPFQQHHRSIDE